MKIDPYRELRERDYAAYVRCVNVASAIAINHRSKETGEVDLALGSAIERALIEQALCFLSPARAF